MKQLNKSMGKKNLLIVSLLVFTFMFAVQVSALDDLGSAKVNQQYQFCQVCQDASFITLSSIQTPTSSVLINENMTSTGSGQFCYNYTPIELGRYDFRGISDGCEGTFATYLEVTPSGKLTTSADSNFGVGVMFFIVVLGIVFISMGFYFISKSFWLTWLGIFFFVIGFFLFYQDLHLANLYAQTVAINTGADNSTTNVFVMVTRFIKLLPYFSWLIVGFAIVRLLRMNAERKKDNDGWDNNSY